MPMVGEAVPFVLIPRFSSYIGPGSYNTVPLDVTEYSQATVVLWLGQLTPTGTGCTFKLYVETSHDGNTWFLEPSGSPGYDPGDDASVGITFTCRRRFLRVRVTTTGTDASITCWCAGLLDVRVEE